MPQFSVIIPVFNKWELTRNCLASLREHGSGPSFEVIVVDNGSSDATAPELASYGKSLFGDRFRAIVFPKNKNFGPACNAGARAARTPVLFFLNNDTRVTSGWSAPLLAALMADKTLGAVGPLLLYPDDTVQHLGVAYGAEGPTHVYRGFPKDHPVVHTPRELQAITGAALMIGADLFIACGGFYTEYKNGYEDIDLCVQIQKRRKKVRCIPESVIYHLESQTPNRKEGEEDNVKLFTRKCARNVYIDLHAHALADGFEPFVADTLGIGVRLRKEDDAALSKAANNKSVEFCFHLVSQNPLWGRGWEMLAAWLEKSGKMAEAIVCHSQLVRIEPMLDRFQKLLSFTPYDAPDAPWIEHAENNIRHIIRLLENRSFMEQTIQRTMGKYMRKEDAFLQQAYAEKVREFFPG